MNSDGHTARKQIRAGRVHARRLEEGARSFFDGLVILFATLAGVATTHGAVWIGLTVGALVVILVGRAVALWSLQPDIDQQLEALDAREAQLAASERYERGR